MKFHVSHANASPEQFSQSHCQHSLCVATISVMHAATCYSLLLGGLFKLENTTTLTFYKLKICPSSECFKAGHWYSRVQSHIFLQHYYNYPNLNYISLFLSSNKCTCDLYFSYDKSSATVRLVPVVTSVKTSPNFTEFLRSVRITAAFV